MNTDGRRVARMEKEVHQSVANYLISNFRCSYSSIITVTRVMMPADLRTAKVYVSILLPDGPEGTPARTELEYNETIGSIIEELQDRAPDFQHYLAHQLKSRFCPKLKFFEDETTEHVLKVERILRDLKKEES